MIFFSFLLRFGNFALTYLPVKKYLQKALSILLILCLGTGALLYLFYDIAQMGDKHLAQQEIKAKEKLENIQLSLQEFKELNGSDELWHNGELYDIYSYSVQGSFVSVTVFHDCNEESLIQNIVESFEPNDKIASDNLVHIARHHIHPPTDGKILCEHSFNLIAGPGIASLPYYYSWSFYPLQFFSILKPPPEAGIFI